MSHWLERTELLIGNDRLNKLQESEVLVVGLGGVGASAAEMLTRAGIGNMTIVDGDVIDVTNINRQLPAVHSLIGKKKADIVAGKLRDINPDINLTVISEYIEDKDMPQLVDTKFNYILDAIDTLSPKVELLYNAWSKNIKIVSSFGAGGKFDPGKVTVTDIKKTYNCPLGRYIRKQLHRRNVYKGIKVVFSPELVFENSVRIEHGRNKKSTVGTISYMPPIFGAVCASVVIRDLLEVK